MKRTLKDKLIAEAFDFYKIDSMLDDVEFIPRRNRAPDVSNNFDDLDDEFPDEDPDDFQDDEFDSEEFGDDDLDDTLDDEVDASEESSSNPNKEGLLRTVRGAYLVYKRATAEGNFEELWVYNMGNVKTQTHIRNAILAGTDIDPITLRSPTNDQTAELWSKGNVQYLYVNGLPN